MILHALKRSTIWRWAALLGGWGLLAVMLLQFQAGPLGGANGRAGGGRGLLQAPSPPPILPTSQPLGMLQPRVDHRPLPSEDILAMEAEKRLPSLPIAYWEKHKGKQTIKFYKNKTCAAFPTIYDLEFDNVYWQTLRSSNGTFHFFGAYYDIRPTSLLGPAVRILAMINRIEPTVVTHCQLWFDNQNEPVIVKTLEYKYIWYKKWGNYKQGIFQPYLLACQMPAAYKKVAPASVSIVEKPCDAAKNNLRVIYNKPPEKKKFAVCVKGLDFYHEDLSVRLVEWLELLYLLGADKVFFYQLQVHPNITKVLQHYEQQGKVSVTPLTLPGGQPNAPAFQHLYLTKKTNNKRQNELIPYNDCLYKNLYSYEYIALLDIDEVIMPVKDTDWGTLMDKVVATSNKEHAVPRASYNVRNVYFLDDLQHAHGWFSDIPRYMHMLQHVYRAKNFTKPMQYVKCFHDPQRVLTLHNHFPLACLGSSCTSYAIDTEDAQLQHYRADCVKTLKKSCEQFRQESVMDTTVWRYKDTLVNRVTDTLRTLGFFGPPDS
ncbi:uncharacterized protein LOC143917881 [Arctopsyche grandis]|uniref:uncharacterized protein LOC143917881 n=1 Tax=Arctopsyche grandis TaxID=121162 RepID=UPI00406D766B